MSIFSKLQMEDTTHTNNNTQFALPRTSATTMKNTEDQLLPIANVARIMKKALPENSKVSKTAKETIQECASEFIGFVTGEAADRCRKERRKTINGDDICHAFEALGLDLYADAMRRYVERYRECEDQMMALKVNGSSSTEFDAPRAELSLFGGVLREENETQSDVETTKFL